MNRVFGGQTADGRVAELGAHHKLLVGQRDRAECAVRIFAAIQHPDGVACVVAFDFDFLSAGVTLHEVADELLFEFFGERGESAFRFLLRCRGGCLSFHFTNEI